MPRTFNFLSQEIATVHAAALILGVAGLASRLVGILRNRLLFAEFGAGRELDIYYAAFQIPDFLSTLFLLGAASAAVLPVFQEYLAAGKERAQAFISLLSSLFFLGALAVCGIVFFAMPALLPFVAPGFSADERALMATLARMMLASPVLFGLSGIFSVVVQSYRLFWVYALAPIFYNFGIIFGILFLVPIFGMYGLGAGVVLGAAAHFILQLGAAVRLGFRPAIIPDIVWNNGLHTRLFQTKSGIGVRKVLMLSFPRVLALSLAQLTFLALIAMGSLLEPGSIAVFSAAHDLYFVPIGIFAISYAVAIFPRLSSATVSRAGAEFFEELFTGVRSILFWVAPSAALAIVLRAHIVRAALGAGAFSWEDTRLTAAVLAVLSVAMAAGAAQVLLIRGFYALGATRLPLLVNAIVSACTVGLAWALTVALASGSSLGHWIAELFRIGDVAHPAVLGLGIAFAAGAMINAVALYFLLIRAGERYFSATAPSRMKEILQILCAAISAGLAAYVIRASFSEIVPLTTFVRVLAQGVAAAGAGFAVYWAALSWLGSEDVASLRRSVLRRLFSLGVLPREWDGESSR